MKPSIILWYRENDIYPSPSFFLHIMEISSGSNLLHHFSASKRQWQPDEDCVSVSFKGQKYIPTFPKILVEV